MNNDIAISVEGLSKAYRIGLKDQQHETFLSAVAAWVKSPFTNFREVRNLSRFDAPGESAAREDIFWALQNVSFDVKQGEAVAIIGRNGAGKSTLLKILSRITEPTQGRARIFGRVGSLLEVGTGFHPDLTGRENVYLNGTILGMKKREIDAKFEEIVEFSGVEKFIDTPVKRYSSGMRVRLAFSVAAHLEPEILVIDEVLAVGDAEFQKRCLGKMEAVATQGRTVLFVSHNMEAVLTLCTKGIVLEGGKVTFIGEAPEAVQLYQRSGMGEGQDRDPHVVWVAPEASGPITNRVEKIEVLSMDGQPKPVVQTWDDVCFRVHYTASEDVHCGSLVLDIKDYRDARLIVLDSGLGLNLRAGRHYVDCCVQRLPLAAGDYSIGVGLALSNTQWLWRNPNVGSIIINGRDVFESGRPP
ncbi:MAG TPA: ABC transporter ATP-binding protein, partial [Verrucomicrobiae bacterium]|nr:ABC transporter ATP-binding protein [Verrucomicrobiae bacterium]